MKRYITAGLMIFIALFSFAQDAGWERPEFASGYAGALDLSYTFSKNDVHTYTVISEAVTVMNLMGTSQKIPINMEIEGKYTVKNANADGSAVIESLITRISGDMSAGFMTIKFDTDKPETMNMQGISDFMLLVNTPFVSTVTKKGKVTDTDTSAIEKKIANSQSGASALRQVIDDSVGQLFVLLPAAKVRKGDVFDGGVTVQEMEGVGQLRSDMKYEVLDISADKKQVLLKPLGSITMDNVKISEKNIDGWLLFRTDRGLMEKSRVDMHIVMQVNVPEAGGSIDMELFSTMKYLLK